MQTRSMTDNKNSVSQVLVETPTPVNQVKIKRVSKSSKPKPKPQPQPEPLPESLDHLINKFKMPIALLGSQEFAKHGIRMPHSWTNEYKTVLNANDADFNPYSFNVVYESGTTPTDKWAISPRGYYWKACNEKAYFNTWWYELWPIPYSRESTGAIPNMNNPSRFVHNPSSCI